MQRGHLYKDNGSWFLKFYDLQHDGMKVARKARTTRLGRVSEFASEHAARLAADKFLEPFNNKRTTPEASQRLKDFIEQFYLPHVEKELRRSTYIGYRANFLKHLRDRLGDVKVREFRTVDGQKLLKSIHAGGTVGHLSLSHIKSMLSGVFTYAMREGVLDNVVNPMTPVKIPGRAARKKQNAYSLDETAQIFMALATPEHFRSPARFVVLVAAFSGLRISEIRGLRWSDYDGENLQVRRSVWGTTVNNPKTAESEAPVPVLEIVQKALKAHKLISKPADDNRFIFVGEKKGFSLNMLNLSRRTIRPALSKAGLKWLGYHAWRRGLATNLYALGASPKVIQSILRHSRVSEVTANAYIQTDDAASRAALGKLEETFSSMFSTVGSKKSNIKNNQ
jgi:integrase